MSPLGVFRSRRVLMLLPLGFASGLPYLLTGSTLLARLTDARVPIETIGVFALVGLPYSLKPLWAPLLDRFTLPLLGRRRGWMLLFQLALAATIAALGFIDPAAAPRLLGAAAVAVAALSASLDIVSDAYKTDVLARDERAAGTAVFVLGYRVAMVLAGGAALVLADHLRWNTVYTLAAAAMIVGVAATVRAPEPPAAAPPRSLRSAALEPLADWFRRPHALVLLAFILIYGAGYTLPNLLAVPFFLGLGFSNSEVGVVFKIVGVAATIAGALGGGALVARLGLGRALGRFAALQGAANLTYAALAIVGPSRALLCVAVAVDSVSTGLSIAALEAFLIALCNRRFSATQFALLAAIAGAGGRLFAVGSGHLVKAAGWPVFFVATALLALPALLLLRVLVDTVYSIDHDEARR